MCLSRPLQLMWLYASTATCLPHVVLCVRELVDPDVEDRFQSVLAQARVQSMD